MPSWGTHLYISKKVAEKLNIDNKAEFMFGNIMPDMYSGWVVRDASKTIIYDISHFGSRYDINASKYMLPDYIAFKEKYINNFDSPLIFGYFCHLLTDHIFNYNAFGKHYIKSGNNTVAIVLNDGSKIFANGDEARICKQRDFALLSHKMLLGMQLPNFCVTCELEKSAKIIEEMQVKKDDIEKVVDYLNNIITEDEAKKISRNDYIMFKKEELEKITNFAIDEIIKEFKSLHN